MHLLGRACRLRDLATSVRNQLDSFSTNGSSLLGRSGTLNLGSTIPPRGDLRIVLRDKPVRRSISRIGISSRKCQRRITLNKAMSITPVSPDQAARGEGQNMGHFSVEIMPFPGQLSAEINKSAMIEAAIRQPDGPKIMLESIDAIGGNDRTHISVRSDQHHVAYT